MYGVEKKENAADISRFGVWKKQIKLNGEDLWLRLWAD